MKKNSHLLKIANQKNTISRSDIGQKPDNLTVSVLRMGIDGNFI